MRAHTHVHTYTPTAWPMQSDSMNVGEHIFLTFSYIQQHSKRITMIQFGCGGWMLLCCTTCRYIGILIIVWKCCAIFPRSSRFCSHFVVLFLFSLNSHRDYRRVQMCVVHCLIARCCAYILTHIQTFPFIYKYTVNFYYFIIGI